MNSLRHIFVKIWGPNANKEGSEAPDKSIKSSAEGASAVSMDTPSEDNKTQDNNHEVAERGVQSIKKPDQQSGNPDRSAGKNKYRPVWWEMQIQAPPQASGDTQFYFADGRSAGNLGELAEALEDISEDEFAHHTEGDINDFAQWVRDVLKDQRCAKLLKHARSRQEAIDVIRLSRSWYNA